MHIITDSNIYKQIISKSKVEEMFSLDLFSVSNLFAFEKGDSIIREGVVSKYLYIFLEGELKVYTTSPSGKVINYGNFNTERPIGEINSLWDTLPVATVEASKDSYCIGISLDKYKEDLLNDNKFLRYLCKLMSERVVSLDCQLANVVAISSDVRLAAYLLQSSTNNVIEMNLRETCEIISVSYRHLLRIIDDFCAKGYIKKEKSTYYILDKDSLTKLSEEFFDYTYMS